MTKSYAAGREYAAELISTGEVGIGCEVDTDEMLNSTNEMPDGDYRAIEREGEEPDARQYWSGYNDYMRERSE